MPFFNKHPERNLFVLVHSRCIAINGACVAAVRHSAGDMADVYLAGGHTFQVTLEEAESLLARAELVARMAALPPMNIEAAPTTTRVHRDLAGNIVEITKE